MKRRTLLKMFCQASVLAIPITTKVARAFDDKVQSQGSESLVLIYDSRASIEYTSLLDGAAPYLNAIDSNWQARLTIWDTQFHKDQIESFMGKYGRNTTPFVGPIIVSVPKNSESDIEVELWNLDWLRAKEDRYVDACYPISGGWWSVDGDWNPSISKVRNHCFKSPNHKGGKFQLPWLDLLKFEELQSLHSDHHREMIKQGKVYWKNVNAECPAL